MPQTIWTVTSWVLFGLAFAWPALALIQWLRQLRRRQRGWCRQCGYDLRGSVSERCAECGYLIDQRVPLVRFRRAITGLTLMFVLLTASHLTNRAEAIRARGWIAAVPTTILIPYVLHRSQPGRSSDSLAATELLYCRAVTQEWSAHGHPFGKSYSGPEIFMWDWQWRWVIERSLDFDFVTDSRGTIAENTARGILDRAMWEDVATGSQRDRILRKVKVNINSRSVWPVGSEIRIRSELLYFGNKPMDFTLEPIEPDRGFLSLEEDIAGRSISVSWPDETTFVGIADRPGPVNYEIRVFQWDDKARQRIEVMRETRTLATIVPADQVPMQAIEIDPALLGQTPVTLLYHRSTIASKVRCVFCLYLSKHPGLVDAIGDSTLAMRIRLKRNGQVIGEGKTWVSIRSTGANGKPFLDGVVGMSFFVDSTLFEAPVSSAESPWSIEIEGDRDTALRDFESTSYWVGKYEFKNIPVEREGP